MKIEKHVLYKRALENYDKNKNIKSALDCLSEDFKRLLENNPIINDIADSIANINAQLQQDINMKRRSDIKVIAERLQTASDKLRNYVNDDRQKAKQIEIR